MKKLIGVTGSFLILCLLINGVLIPSLPNVKAEEKTYTRSIVSSTEPSSEAQPSSTEVSYTLKGYKGKIAVFKSDSETPVKVTDTELSKLPKEDQESLIHGIEVKDRLELERLLEDYCS